MSNSIVPQGVKPPVYVPGARQPSALTDLQLRYIRRHWTGRRCRRLLAEIERLRRELAAQGREARS